MASFSEPGFLESEFLQQNLQNSTEILSTLSLNVKNIESEIQRIVLENSATLISQSVSICELENRLSIITSKIRKVFETVQAMKEEVSKPFQELKNKTRQLVRLSVVSECLRQVVRVMQLYEKLQQSMKASTTRDLAKSAQILNELMLIIEPNGESGSAEEISLEVTLAGITLIEERRQSIMQANVTIRQEATKLLNKSLDSLNQSEIGASLQVFFNLGDLTNIVRDSVNRAISKVSESVAAINIKVLVSDSKESKKGPGSAAKVDTVAWRNSFWLKMDALFETCYQQTIQVWTLLRVLERKTDPTSHAVFIESLSNDYALCQDFWQKLAVTLEKDIEAATNYSSFVKNIFISDYPRLLSSFDSLYLRISGATGGKSASVYFDQNSLNNSIIQYQNSFFSKSLSKLSEPVHLMFGSKTVPTLNDVNGYINNIYSELESIKDTPALLETSIHSIAKSVQLFCTNCESLVEVNERSVPDRNVAIFSILISMENALNHISVSSHLLPPSNNSMEIVSNGFTKVHALITEICSAILEPIFKSFEINYLTVFIAAHKEDYSLTMTDMRGPKFMNEFRHCLHTFCTDRLNLFGGMKQKITHRFFVENCHKLVRNFIHVISLIAPVSSGGNNRLKICCTELISLIEPFVSFSDIQSLRNDLSVFGDLLTLELEELKQILSPESFEGSFFTVLPGYIILNNLFSRACSDKVGFSGKVGCKMPHVLAHNTISAYLHASLNLSDSNLLDRLCKLITEQLNLLQNGDIRVQIPEEVSLLKKFSLYLKERS